MKAYIVTRTLEEAELLCENNMTIRQVAKQMNMSKSTVHLDLSKKLKKIDYNLYKKVNKILINNFNEKHIRGGISTKNKHINIKKLNNN